MFVLGRAFAKAVSVVLAGVLEESDAKIAEDDWNVSAMSRGLLRDSFLLRNRIDALQELAVSRFRLGTVPWAECDDLPNTARIVDAAYRLSAAFVEAVKGHCISGTGHKALRVLVETPGAMVLFGGEKRHVICVNFLQILGDPKYRGPDLNRRPIAYEATALTAELPRQHWQFT